MIGRPCIVGGVGTSSAARRAAGVARRPRPAPALVGVFAGVLFGVALVLVVDLGVFGESAVSGVDTRPLDRVVGAIVMSFGAGIWVVVDVGLFG